MSIYVTLCADKQFRQGREAPCAIWSAAPLSNFKGHHFDSSIIILCVRWYITYKLSYRDLRDMMAERGVELAHTTILRWLQHYVPVFEKKWNRFARPVGRSWRVDETYIRARGQWKYLYRAVDKQGNTVYFLLSEHRDIEAAKRFFTQAIDRHGTPEKITLDGYAATQRAVCELKQSAILPNHKTATSRSSHQPCTTAGLLTNRQEHGLRCVHSTPGQVGS